MNEGVPNPKPANPQNEDARDLERELAALRRRSFFERAADYLFGYDFFIFYRWLDGKLYAAPAAR